MRNVFLIISLFITSISFAAEFKNQKTNETIQYKCVETYVGEPNRCSKFKIESEDNSINKIIYQDFFREAVGRSFKGYRTVCDSDSVTSTLCLSIGAFFETFSGNPFYFFVLPFALAGDIVKLPVQIVKMATFKKREAVADMIWNGLILNNHSVVLHHKIFRQLKKHLINTDEVADPID